MKAVIILALCFVALVNCEHWGVLIAGSNGYWNYRHQSDICHAYQILHKNGIPDDHLIVMQYDDIARDGENPFPGQVFNKPTEAGEPGFDVYNGCLKDYTGAQVTADNFLKVLTGTPTGKKVLNSTSEDNVFVYFSDHGASGLIAMPSGSPLYATQLIEALKTMRQKQMFKKLVFYLEACESGSMFANILSSDIGVYATTAANPDESSWGWYCSPDDHVNGKTIGSCLGDEYSVRYMEDSDLGKTESLQQQFLTVQQQTTKSHVCQYGDMSYTGDSIFSFQGAKDAATSHLLLPAHPAKPSFGVDSRDVKLHYLYSKYTREQSAQAAEALQAELKTRQQADSLFHTLARTVMGNQYASVFGGKTQGICDEKCCQPVVNKIYAHCGGFSDYSLKYVRSIVQMCESDSNSEAMSNYMQTALEDLC